MLGASCQGQQKVASGDLWLTGHVFDLSDAQQPDKGMSASENCAKIHMQMSSLMLQPMLA